MSSARLAAIVESSEDAITSNTLQGIITSWNRGAERIYGYSAEEAVGQPLSILVPPESPDEIRGILDRIKRGEKVDQYETVRMTKDGRRVDVSTTVSPMKNSDGNIVGASIIARDITERKRAEEALRNIRDVERRRMARDLHDGVLQDLIYTAAAMEVTKLKAEGTGLEDELRQGVDAMRAAVQGLRAAVNDLHLEAEGNLPLPSLLVSLVERNRTMARNYEIELEVGRDVPDKPLGKPGTELLRIIQEALTNARRHSGAEKILVNVRVEGDHLVAEVSDDGRGFGAVSAPGVGLRRMQERAAALRGELEVESAPGKGTTVRVRAPNPNC